METTNKARRKRHQISLEVNGVKCYFYGFIDADSFLRGLGVMYGSKEFRGKEGVIHANIYEPFRDDKRKINIARKVSVDIVFENKDYKPHTSRKQKEQALLLEQRLKQLMEESDAIQKALERIKKVSDE